ncbi:Endo-chitosanase [Lachnellula hyalina]|uniref:Endo-chitosanase n=1 Tax=Lachnellula hyalina TaxID=1316788 RepID=A0A8H8QXP3_9HELO|nr:Endo-chitosanase [Lachnellula hyalina]TVY24767.1 Endo-chitosanase [Lachnellula hyalina]
MRSYSPFLGIVLASRCLAADVPSNVQSFYDGIKSAGSCSKKLSEGFYAHDDGPNTFFYCGDHLDDYQVIYLQGTGGAMADMDIDCDGEQHGKGDDGRCGPSDDTQSQTSFEDTVASYNKGVTDLNAFVHPYVVFGNVGSKGSFDPQSKGVEPLSLMAVVCGGKMFYGIWGDENGDDGPKAVIGEASISMATFCFGNSVNGNSGHDETDVLYIAFTGEDAVPGAGAAWDADSATDFESSIKSLGDKLIQRIGDGSGTTISSLNPILPATTLKTLTKSSSAGAPTSTGNCSWPGHCAGKSHIGCE